MLAVHLLSLIVPDSGTNIPDLVLPDSTVGSAGPGVSGSTLPLGAAILLVGLGLLLGVTVLRH